ncbi:MAG: PKD domain-containing protein [Chitinophagaceae bacterium]|nr:PKD domain-containing protein [Chitinophagaceae bacterium]
MKNKLKNIAVLFGVTIISSCSTAEIGACFNASDNNVSVNEVITFTNCSSLQTATQQCNWSFGDGKDTVVLGNAAVKHAYKTIGQYQVKLTTGEGTNLSTHTLDVSVF